MSNVYTRDRRDEAWEEAFARHAHPPPLPRILHAILPQGVLLPHMRCKDLPPLPLIAHVPRMRRATLTGKIRPQGVLRPRMRHKLHLPARHTALFPARHAHPPHWPLIAHVPRILPQGVRTPLMRCKLLKRRKLLVPARIARHV